MMIRPKNPSKARYTTVFQKTLHPDTKCYEIQN